MTMRSFPSRPNFPCLSDRRHLFFLPYLSLSLSLSLSPHPWRAPAGLHVYPGGPSRLGRLVPRSSSSFSTPDSMDGSTRRRRARVIIFASKRHHSTRRPQPPPPRVYFTSSSGAFPSPSFSFIRLAITLLFLFFRYLGHPFLVQLNQLFSLSSETFPTNPPIE